MIHSGSLGSNMLSAKLQPFVKSDDSSGLEIHGIKHLLSGSILVLLGLVEIGIGWCITISSGHGGSCIDQLREGSLADQTISVGIGINEDLQQGMIKLRVRVTFLVLDAFLTNQMK